MPDPDLLLLDEPAASLDLGARETLLARSGSPRRERAPGGDRARLAPRRGDPARLRRRARPRRRARRSPPARSTRSLRDDVLAGRSACRSPSSAATAGPGRGSTGRHAADTRPSHAAGTMPRDHDDHAASRDHGPDRRHGPCRGRRDRRDRDRARRLGAAGRPPRRVRPRSSPRSARSSSTSSRRARRTSSSRCSAPTTSSPSSSSSSRSRSSIGAGLGILARRRFAVAARVFVAFGVVGFLATLRDPLASPAMAGAASAVSIGRSGAGLPRWRRAHCRRRSLAIGRRRPIAPGRAVGPDAGMPDWSRRSFLIRAGCGRRRRGRGRGRRPDAARAPAGRARAGSDRRSRRHRGPCPPLGPRPTSPATIAGLTPIVMPNDRFYRIDTALLTPSVDTATWSLRIHGLVDRETTLTWDELIGLPDVRAVRDDLLRQQRGRRRARRQREVDRRPAARRPRARRRPGRRDAARRPLGGRLDGRDADGLGHGPGARADDRAEDERRAAAAGPRLSGPADRARAVRLRVGDEVAHRARADHARGVRRLLGPARLGQGGADPDAVADRHAATAAGSPPDACRSPGSPGRRTAASPGSRSASTAPGSDARLSHADLRRDLGPVGRPTGTRRPGEHASRSAPPTATGASRPSSRTPPAPDGARGWHTISVQVG